MFTVELVSSFLSSLEPEWTAAATAVKEQTKGRVRLGAVDATVHQVISSRYGVSGKLTFLNALRPDVNLQTQQNAALVQANVSLCSVWVFYFLYLFFDLFVAF